ncbi:hypothetical protein [Streptomyces sp. NBC_01304]|uniref:hypothetical protein n=1 Tax=Streptomyces sp. NBC_01304 TaxID=2903818 RepID=UPI002E113BE6|nr:hypothetical protein OG430_48340 [Streptomyces sp. NBC_01304]
MVDKALRAASAQQEDVVREVFRAAGLMWQCARHRCRFDNPMSAQLCVRCGRQRDGRRVDDVLPASADPEDFEALREALIEYFENSGKQAPDAVTFHLNFENEWTSYATTLQYGARQEAHSFDAEVAMALDDLGPAEEPGEELRVTLPR